VSSSLEIINHSGGSDISWLHDLIPGQPAISFGTNPEFRFEWRQTEGPRNVVNWMKFFELMGTWRYVPDLFATTRRLSLGSIWIELGEGNNDQRVSIASSDIKEIHNELIQGLGALQAHYSSFPRPPATYSPRSTSHDPYDDILDRWNEIAYVLGSRPSEILGLGWIDDLIDPLNPTTIQREKQLWEVLNGHEQLMTTVEKYNRRIIKDLAHAALDGVRNSELVDSTGWLGDLFAVSPAGHSENSATDQSRPNTGRLTPLERSVRPETQELARLVRQFKLKEPTLTYLGAATKVNELLSELKDAGAQDPEKKRKFESLKRRLRRELVSEHDVRNARRAMERIEGGEKWAWSKGEPTFKR